jgi:hypothetical protein
VCHSLGGVVLKEALVISNKATDPEHHDLNEVGAVTTGLILLGVPNLGLRHEQLRTVVRGRPNEGFIKDLLIQLDGEASQFLSQLTREFAHLCRRQHERPWKIISYYETVRSPTVAASDSFHKRQILLTNFGQTSEDGSLATNGPKEFMVTRNSAERISDRVRDVDHLPSEADHRGLVRFDHSHDDRYVSVIEKLKAMLSTARSMWAVASYVLQKYCTELNRYSCTHFYNVGETCHEGSFSSRSRLH